MSSDHQAKIKAFVPLSDGRGVTDTLDLRTWADGIVHIRVRGQEFVVDGEQLLRAVKAVTTK